MKTYKTSEVARIIGVHPNTVRLYEKIGFISAAERGENGYRAYTELHIAQLRLVRTAMRAEVLQNGLRGKAVGIARLAAEMRLSEAELAAEEYLLMIDAETERAKTAVSSVEKLLGSKPADDDTLLTRKQAASALGVTADALRNWELNGLFKIRRKENGYRVYSSADMTQLSIIRTLRCANYSLAAILRLMNNLSEGGSVSVSGVLNTPSPDEEIISVCDRLLVSLADTRADALSISEQLGKLKKYKPST